MTDAPITHAAARAALRELTGALPSHPGAVLERYIGEMEAVGAAVAPSVLHLPAPSRDTALCGAPVRWPIGGAGLRPEDATCVPCLREVWLEAERWREEYRTVLGAQEGETLGDACERVVDERDSARAACRAVDPEHARLVAAAETHDALLRVAREERDEAEAECARLREALDAVRRERDALRAEVADLLPLADAQAFAGGVAQREIETLRANLSNANAELCALRARVDAQSGVIAASATLRVEYNEAVAQHCAAATEATTLRAQLAAAEERAARGFETGRDTAAEWARAEADRCDREAHDLAARGKPTRAERRWDTWRRINRLAEVLSCLTPPEAPDA